MRLRLLITLNVISWWQSVRYALHHQDILLYYVRFHYKVFVCLDPYTNGDGCITVDQGEIMMCEPGWINELHYIVECLFP